jgi:uncharacterized protein (DUF58 family)
MVLLDASRSMDSGNPGKLAAAKRIACILAAIAYGAGNRAGLLALGPGLLDAFVPERTRTSLEAFEDAAARVRPLSTFTPAAAMDAFVARHGRRCVAVLVSDLMFPEWPQVLGALSASGCESQVIQVLSRDELDPPYRGETTLVDSETLGEAPLHADAPTLARYVKELGAFLRATSLACARLGLGYALAPSDEDPGRLFRDDLREGGFLC